MTTPHTTTTQQPKPVLVVWEVADERVEMTPSGAAICSCDAFLVNAKQRGMATCEHIQAVNAERARRKQGR